MGRFLSSLKQQVCKLFDRDSIYFWKINGTWTKMNFGARSSRVLHLTNDNFKEWVAQGRNWNFLTHYILFHITPDIHHQCPSILFPSISGANTPSQATTISCCPTIAWLQVLETFNLFSIQKPTPFSQNSWPYEPPACNLSKMLTAFKVKWNNVLTMLEKKITK